MPQGIVGSDPNGRPMRADARRNYERILAVAGDAIARHGAEASLEEIARQAGVGSATLHRHFPSRQALLEAVFSGRVRVLCDGADDLAATLDPGPALVAWLHAVGRHAASNRGLATSLLRGAHDGDPAFGATCHAMIVAAGGALLDRARLARAVRPDVTIVDLLTLTNAISLATEQQSDGADEADRLLSLALKGIRPQD